MNKNILLSIAIGSLSSLCYGMFNSNTPASNQISQQLYNQMMNDAEIRRQQAQQQYFNAQMEIRRQQAQQQAQQQIIQSKK